MSDKQLQLALAKMLPGQLIHTPQGWYWCTSRGGLLRACLDTEWLHACWLVEQTLHPMQQAAYAELLADSIRETENKYFGDPTNKKWPFNEWGLFTLANRTWQQRAEALCKVKGVTV